ncbi:Chromate reductase [Methylacidimicrobium cyclopophantes]|uniref:Chromate reductase n=1 Tax=Methylacidimicrobium cyclopophantes TaxID=1041766 RepID=A0A5E6MP87_9BACT|nr:NADPH-dependent FMN reductase [Methylacidimicrobium cyclopophantes]VVM07248.1 Chromate reductase [Methylacidimicrobium cyclopophantes]
MDGNKAGRKHADKFFCRSAPERRDRHGTRGLPSEERVAQDERIVIAILIGTNRLGSRTRLVGAQLIRLYAELGQEVHPIDLGLLSAEVGSPSAYGKRPAEVGCFAHLLEAARGIVLALPEYNGSFPGILKLFFDLLPHPSPLEGKPICLVGVARGRFGGLRAVEQMQNHLLYRRAHLYPYPVLLSDIDLLLGKTGRIEAPDVAKRLREQAEGFLRFAARLLPESGASKEARSVP